MTTDELRETGRALCEAADGKDIQYHTVGGNWRDVSTGLMDRLGFTRCRRKPQPTVRAWQTVEEVPIGETVEWPDGARGMIVAAEAHVECDLEIIVGSKLHYAPALLSEAKLVSGQPCGVEEGGG